MEQPQVGAVVLNWNNYRDTKRCIESLLRVDYYIDICIVDNDSSDGSGRKLEQEFDNIDFIHNGYNMGFAGGINQGLERLVGKGLEYIWVLNNDIIVPGADTLTKLVEVMEENANIGAITPAVNNYPDTNEKWFRQGLVDWKSGNSHHKSEYSSQTKEQNLIYNDFVPFCSTLFRTTVFDDIGYLPEEYFLYHEDVEFCKRMTNRGYQIATYTSVQVFHDESSSTGGKLSETMTYYTARNRWLLSRRVDEVNKVNFYIHYIQWSLETLIFAIYSSEPNAVLAWIQGTKDGIVNKTKQGPYP